MYQNLKKAKRIKRVNIGRPRELTLVQIAADIKEDLRMTCKELASSHAVSNGTMHKILHDDLGLVEKWARLVPKLLSKNQKKKRKRTCKDAIAAINLRSMAMLDKSVSMDGIMLSYYMSEMKMQSKQ